jgi:hypothetical protein
MYEMHKDFMIIILTNAGDTDFDDGMVQMALDVIPNQELFFKCYAE